MTQSSQNPTYYNIADGVTAFSTTRHGGVGQGAYASFNINEWCGDDPQHIAENRQMLADELGLPSQNIIMPHQTHGISTRIIAKEFMTLPDNIRRMLLEGVDAVMTDLAGVCIGVSTADCIPVLLYDEAHHAVCAIHAGWRGTVARIVLKAITDMRAAYHTAPAQLKAVIGPGISERNFEVGDEVYEAFAEAMLHGCRGTSRSEAQRRSCRSERQVLDEVAYQSAAVQPHAAGAGRSAQGEHPGHSRLHLRQYRRLFLGTPARH